MALSYSLLVVESHKFCNHIALVQIPAPPLFSYVALDKLLTFSVPLFPHLIMNIIIPTFIELLGELNMIICIVMVSPKKCYLSLLYLCVIST